MALELANFKLFFYFKLSMTHMQPAYFSKYFIRSFSNIYFNYRFLDFFESAESAGRTSIRTVPSLKVFSSSAYFVKKFYHSAHASHGLETKPASKLSYFFAVPNFILPYGVIRDSSSFYSLSFLSSVEPIEIHQLFVHWCAIYNFYVNVTLFFLDLNHGNFRLLTGKRPTQVIKFIFLVLCNDYD